MSLEVSLEASSTSLLSCGSSFGSSILPGDLTTGSMCNELSIAPAVEPPQKPHRPSATDAGPPKQCVKRAPRKCAPLILSQNGYGASVLKCTSCFEVLY